MRSEFFRNQVFVASGLLAQAGGMLVYAMIFYLPLFLQGVVGQTATKAGTSLAPLFLPVAVGTVMGGQVIAKVERYLAVYMAYQTDCQRCASSLATTSTGAC